MQIPTEALPLLTLHRDPGVITMPRAPARKDDFIFSKLLQSAQVESDPQPSTKSRAPGMTAEAGRDGTGAATAYKRGKYDEIASSLSDEEMSMVAGVLMGNQSKVVFILEGDMESDTSPEPAIIAAADETDISVYPETTAGETVAKTPVDIETGPDINAVAGHGDETIQVENDIRDAVSALKTENAQAETVEKAIIGDGQATVNYAAEEAAADTEIKTAAPNAVDTIDDSSEAADITGDAAARMPVDRTSERTDTEDRERDSGSSENGHLSPLENENDKTAVKTRKDKESMKTEDPAGKTREKTDEPVNELTAPALTDVKPERFRTDIRMTETQAGQAHSSPVGTDNLFDEMVARIDTDMTESARTMTIQLKPEFLGKVALEIAMDAAGLHVKISADDLGVRSMVNSQINALIESLQNKGIEVVEVEVAYTGVDNGSFTDPKKRDAQPDNSKRARSFETIPDDMILYSALPLDVMEYYIEEGTEGVSSVEYRA